MTENSVYTNVWVRAGVDMLDLEETANLYTYSSVGSLQALLQEPSFELLLGLGSSCYHLGTSEQELESMVGELF